MKKDAKMEVLKKMKKKHKEEDMDKMIKPDLQKVTVMSDSKEGLKEGLSKAEEIMEGRMSMLEKDDKKKK